MVDFSFLDCSKILNLRLLEQLPVDRPVSEAAHPMRHCGFFVFCFSGRVITDMCGASSHPGFACDF